MEDRMQRIDMDKKNEKVEKENENKIQKQFQIKNVIGSGTFGTVYYAFWKDKGIDVAIKSIAKKQKYKNRQIQLLSTLNHPNITNLLMHYQSYDIKSQKYYINLVMEYLPTTLFSMIRNVNGKYGKICVVNCVKYTKKILQGLAYLEQLNICHRDIKPSNILIDQMKQKVQICDFGSAKKLKQGEVSITYVCSRYYRAPELILGCGQYTTKVDVWAAGCVIAEMVTCLPLFDGDNNQDQLVKIIKVIGAPTKSDLLALKVEYLDSDFTQLNPITLSSKIRKGNINCPNQLIDLLQRLIVYDPGRRMSARQALDHVVFKKYLEK